MMSMRLGGVLVLGLLFGEALGAVNPWVGELPDCAADAGCGMI